MGAAVSILTIGSEILDGRVQDTNSQYICDELSKLGISVMHILSCDDNISDIKNSLQFISRNSRSIIVSGGLGPTDDDLTREAIAEFVSVPLVKDEDALTQIKEIFTKRGRKFEPANEKQAFIPEGAKVIPNKSGTAPGFKVSFNSVDIYSLPGVPWELKKMFEVDVLPQLTELSSDTVALKTEAIKLFGLPESVVGARVSALGLPKDITVSYRAAFPEIHVLLKSRSNKSLNEYARKTISAIGEEFVFANSLETTFEQALHSLLLEKKVTVATAESCTGGLAAVQLTSNPGSSTYFLGSAVVYANSAKTSQIKVPENLIEKEGAVSYAVAKSMAENCRSAFSSDIAVSITGIAGPDGGSDEKPVGLFFIGIADSNGTTALRYFMPSSRPNVRRYAAYLALDALRRRLLNLDFLAEYEIKYVSR